MRTFRQRKMYPDTAYVGFGRDESSEAERYWVAVWDDEPLSGESYANTIDEARGMAARIGYDHNLPHLECDEFGPKAATPRER